MRGFRKSQRTRRKTIAGKVTSMFTVASFVEGAPPVWKMRIERANGMMLEGTVPKNATVKVGDLVQFNATMSYHHGQKKGKFGNPRKFEVLPYSASSSNNGPGAL